MFMTMFVTPCHESFSHRVTKTLRESFFSSPCLFASVAIFFHGKDHKEELFISFVVHGFLLVVVMVLPFFTMLLRVVISFSGTGNSGKQS